jgi:hypothetical protein
MEEPPVMALLILTTFKKGRPILMITMIILIRTVSATLVAVLGA